MGESNHRLRNTSVCGIELPVFVDHSALPSSARIEHSQTSHETLNVTFDVQYYHCNDVQTEQFDDIFNYAPVVKQIQELTDCTITYPIESIADEILEWLIHSATGQDMHCVQIRVVIIRPNLAGLDIKVESAWRSNQPY